MSVLAAATLAAAAFPAFRPAPEPPSPAVAMVNGTPILQRDVQIRLSELLPSAPFHGRLPDEKLLGLRRAALDDLILDELISEEAASAGITPDARTTEAEVAAIRGRFGSDREFDAALASNGLSRRLFRAYVERSVVVKQSRRAHAPADPTDADVRAYYEANAQKFSRPEQVHLLELLVAIDPSGGRPAEQKAETRARGLLRRLRQGDDFASLAWAESEDAYRVKSGDLGWVHRGRLDPDLEAAVFAAPTGALRTARSLLGIHVFKVIAREPARQLTQAEAHDIIVVRLRRARQEAAEQEWRARLRATATIEILDPELRQATPSDVPQPGIDGIVASGAPTPAVASH